MPDTQFFLNSNRRSLAKTFQVKSTSSLEFHRKLPGYKPGPLYAVPALAEQFAVDRVWVKDEPSRFGLTSFMILGTSSAPFQALS